MSEPYIKSEQSGRMLLRRGEAQQTMTIAEVDGTRAILQLLDPEEGIHLSAVRVPDSTRMVGVCARRDPANTTDEIVVLFTVTELGGLADGDPVSWPLSGAPHE